jgi:hypothetical protein
MCVREGTHFTLSISCVCVCTISEYNTCKNIGSSLFSFKQMQQQRQQQNDRSNLHCHTNVHSSSSSSTETSSMEDEEEEEEEFRVWFEHKRAERFIQRIHANSVQEKRRPEEEAAQLANDIAPCVTYIGTKDHSKSPRVIFMGMKRRVVEWLFEFNRRQPLFCDELLFPLCEHAGCIQVTHWTTNRAVHMWAQLLRHAEQNLESECLVWKGRTNEQGEGVYTGLTGTTSRVLLTSYLIHVGMAHLPKDVHVFRRTDCHPTCFAPQHIVAVHPTPKTNKTETNEK